MELLQKIKISILLICILISVNFLLEEDSKGRVVGFKNTVIIATSNIGSAQTFELTSKDAPYEVLETTLLEE
ncbi:MAG: hypothetical protein ACXACK_18185, partial [Candidatus Hodarchaeales archaeon]